MSPADGLPGSSVRRLARFGGLFYGPYGLTTPSSVLAYQEEFMGISSTGMPAFGASTIILLPT
jgi:hypothetical protein